MPNNEIAIIILAAGSSSRLGNPKQLLAYKDTTLIGHAVETAKETGCENILVIAGAYYNEISAKINPLKIKLVENRNWQAGMSSSIHAGINVLKDSASVKGVLIMLCDQPLISALHLVKLTESLATNPNKIVATGYKGIAGVPAIFPKGLFPKLLNLKGDEGARDLIKVLKDEVFVLPFEDAFLDIDTDADYQKLMTILANHNK